LQSSRDSGAENKNEKDTMKLIAAMAAVALFAAGIAFAQNEHTSSRFEGAKANKGTVTHAAQNGKNILTLSDDFKAPDTPAPHWQVVDSKGHAYLLNRLVIKGDKFNKSVTLPDYIQDVAKVQIWCSWAEVVLGEARFEKPIELAGN
jgi:hypothetical protein